MVVLGIFAVLAVMAYGGLASVLTARTHVSEALERTVELQKAYLALRNDFQQLRARPVRDGFGEIEGSLLLQRDGGVEFTRSGWRNPLGAPRSALERVGYRLDGQKKELVRSHWRVLDRAPQSTALETPVLTQVESLEWRFMDAQREWHTAWPELSPVGLPATDTPPRAVEITLHLKDLGAVRLLFSATNAAPQSATLPLQGGLPVGGTL
jgi:general secretion pathway protein J